jgi:aspartyl aminopeptidase
MNEVIFNHETLKAGDKVWFNMMGKAIALVQLGSDPLEQGMNILCAHIDSPRLDLKPRPLYEADGLCLLDTHYYGGIKKYQWTALPLALYGVVVLKDGTQMDVAIGDHEDDPVFVVTDLLPHLAAEQMKKSAPTVVEGEDLNVLFGSIPEKGTDKDPVKANILKLLKDAYGIDEADFISAELEVVPQGKARTLGLDKSMILGYGQDDRSCAYPSLIAQLECGPVKRTAMTILADKEEIGSVGATGMQSRFFENLVAELLHAQGNDSLVALNRTLQNSTALSNDVTAAHDPNYAAASSPNGNQAMLGGGFAMGKYTGSRGKSGSNDASAEFIAALRRIFDDNHVVWQMSELGKVDLGGGGTIAYLLANYGMQVIDGGVALLNMHAPFEVSSKADLYETKKACLAFLQNME